MNVLTLPWPALRLTSAARRLPPPHQPSPFDSAMKPWGGGRRSSLPVGSSVGRSKLDCSFELIPLRIQQLVRDDWSRQARAEPRGAAVSEGSHDPFPEFEAVEVFDHYREVRIQEVVDLDVLRQVRRFPCRSGGGGDNRISLIGYCNKTTCIRYREHSCPNTCPKHRSSVPDN